MTKDEFERQCTKVEEYYEPVGVCGIIEVVFKNGSKTFWHINMVDEETGEYLLNSEWCNNFRDYYRAVHHRNPSSAGLERAKDTWRKFVTENDGYLLPNGKRKVNRKTDTGDWI